MPPTRDENGLSPFRVPAGPSLERRKPNAMQRRQSLPSGGPSPPVAAVANGDETKGRNKVFTGTGYSGFDWGNLPIEPPQSLRRISTEELALHSTEDDVWLAVQGRVYNVTQYVAFHPGGKYQIMRGRGKDATELFMKAHPWINPESLLKRVWLGFLVKTAVPPASSASPPSTDNPPL